MLSSCRWCRLKRRLPRPSCCGHSSRCRAATITGRRSRSGFPWQRLVLAASLLLKTRFSASRRATWVKFVCALLVWRHCYRRVWPDIGSCVPMTVLEQSSHWTGKSGRIRELRRSGKVTEKSRNFVDGEETIACIVRLCNCCCNIVSDEKRDELSCNVLIGFLLFILFFFKLKVVHLYV